MEINSFINIANNEGILVTESIEVALNFEKEHSKVIRSIENTMGNEPSQNWLRYFIQDEYRDAQGKPRKQYLLTRDGFSLLVMGFTGQKALQWKLKYIEAFNSMERSLKSKKFSIDSEGLQCIKETNKTLKFIQDKNLRENIAKQVLSKLYDIEISIPEITTTKEIEIDKTVIDFISGHCKREENALIKINVLYECYVSWCSLNSLKALSKINFGRYMKLLGFEQEHRKIGRLWKGIKI
jgi:Rha family phage regulatory protein